METKIKQIINERGLKQGFIADKANVSRAALSLIINGKSIPSLPVAIRISRVLEKTVEELWGDLVE